METFASSLTSSLRSNLESTLENTLTTLSQQAAHLSKEYDATADTTAPSELQAIHSILTPAKPSNKPDDAATTPQPPHTAPLATPAAPTHADAEPDADASPPPTARAKHRHPAEATPPSSRTAAAAASAASAASAATPYAASPGVEIASRAEAAVATARAEAAELRARVEAARAAEASEREARAVAKAEAAARALSDLREGSTLNDEVASLLAAARAEGNASLERARQQFQAEADALRSQLDDSLAAAGTSAAADEGSEFVQVVAESQPLGAPVVMAVGSSSPAQAASLSAALADADRQLVQTEAELVATHLDAASSESTLKSELGHMQEEIQRLRAEAERLREQLASETASVEAAARAEMAAHAAAADAAAEADAARDAADAAEAELAAASKLADTLAAERDQLFEEASQLQRDVAALRDETKGLRRQLAAAKEAANKPEKASISQAGSSAGAAAVRVALGIDARGESGAGAGGFTVEKYNYLRQTTLDLLMSAEIGSDEALGPIAAVLELSEEERSRIRDARAVHSSCSLAGLAAGLSDPTSLARTHPHVHAALAGAFARVAEALRRIVGGGGSGGVAGEGTSAEPTSAV